MAGYRKAALRIRGIDKVLTRLRNDELTASQTLNACLRLAAIAVINEAKEILEYEVYSKYHPEFEELTGRLMRSFRSISLTAEGVRQVRSITNTAPYAPFVERGTQPHPIDPHNPPEYLRWPDFEGWAYAKHVDHPGSEAVHFLRDAMERARPQVIAIFRQYFRSAQAREGLELSVIAEGMSISAGVLD